MGAGIVDRAFDTAALLFLAAEEADATGRVSPEAWHALHDSGLAMAPFPLAMGGEDLTAPAWHRDLFDVLRVLGSGDLSVARLFEGHVNAVALVRRYGTEDQLGALADQVTQGALSAVWGVDDAHGLRAAPCGSAWRLDGRKILASGAGFITHPLVPAGTDAGQLMLLPTLRIGERSDLSAWTAQGMRSTATGAVDFSGLLLGPAEVVGVPGDFMRQPDFSGGAWRFCAVQLGAAERLVDLFRAHLLSRGRGGDPYQLQRIAQCTAAVGSAAFWIAEAARQLADATACAESVVAFAHLTRMVTERAALDVLEAVHRGVGLAASMRPNPIERISRDLATYLRQPNPDLAMADAARVVLASARPTGDLWGAGPATGF